MDAKQFHQALLEQRLFKENIPIFLKTIRQERGWTQTILAEKLQIGRTYVTMLELGEREMPEHLLRRLDTLLNEITCPNCQQSTMVDVCPQCGHERA